MFSVSLSFWSFDFTLLRANLSLSFFVYFPSPYSSIFVVLFVQVFEEHSRLCTSHPSLDSEALFFTISLGYFSTSNSIPISWLIFYFNVWFYFISVLMDVLLSCEGVHIYVLQLLLKEIIKLWRYIDRYFLTIPN